MDIVHAFIGVDVLQVRAHTHDVEYGGYTVAAKHFGQAARIRDRDFLAGKIADALHIGIGDRDCRFCDGPRAGVHVIQTLRCSRESGAQRDIPIRHRARENVANCRAAATRPQNSGDVYASFLERALGERHRVRHAVKGRLVLRDRNLVASRYSGQCRSDNDGSEQLSGGPQRKRIHLHDAHSHAY